MSLLKNSDCPHKCNTLLRSLDRLCVFVSLTNGHGLKWKLCLLCSKSWTDVSTNILLYMLWSVHFFPWCVFFFHFSGQKVDVRKGCVAVVCEMETCCECSSVNFKLCATNEFLMGEDVPPIEIHYQILVIYRDYINLSIVLCWVKKGM